MLEHLLNIQVSRTNGATLALVRSSSIRSISAILILVLVVLVLIVLLPFAGVG